MRSSAVASAAALLLVVVGGGRVSATPDPQDKQFGPHWWSLLPSSDGQGGVRDPLHPWKGFHRAERASCGRECEVGPRDYAVNSDFENSPGWNTSKRVVIVGCDGLGTYWTRGIFGGVSGLPLNFSTPNFDRLRKLGAFSDVARAVYQTVSAPNWQAFMSGAGPEETGVYANGWYVGSQMEPVTGPTTYFPSMFRVAKNARGSAAKTAMYADWSGVWDLLDRSAVDLERKYAGRHKTVEMAEEFVDFVFKSRTFSDFSIAMFYIASADEGGHGYRYGSPGYHRSVTIVDNALGVLLDGIEATYGWDDTLLLLGADHGGDDYLHWPVDPYERHFYTPFMAAGAGVRKGFNIPCPTAGYPCSAGGKGRDVRNMDIASTALHSLGIAQPRICVGRPVTEMWGDSVDEPGVEHTPDGPRRKA